MSGYDSETLRPVVVDLEKQLGKSIFIRVIDDASGSWGHINFDEFLFYAEKPQVENELKAPAPAPPMDTVKFAGLSPERAAKEMTLPPGFSATVFAAEPDVVQPLAFTIDHRGRLWVVEGLQYPVRAEGDKGRGQHPDLRRHRWRRQSRQAHGVCGSLNLVSGIEVGFGGRVCRSGALSDVHPG